ncbi:MAG: protease modulator HflK, partial [Burkholderia contaminans]
IYSNSTKVFVGNKGGNSVVYLPLDKLVEQGRQNAAASTGASVPDAASAPAAVAPAAAAPASAASGTDVLRSREAFRSRSREDDLK